MLRSVLAVTAGIVAAGLVIGLVQAVGMTVIPPPAGMAEAFEKQDFEQLALLIQALPLGSLLFVLLSYAIGAWVGGMTAGAIAQTYSQPWPALVVGTILFLFAVLNFFQIPHPVWMVVASLVVFHPLAWLGSWLAVRFFGGSAKSSLPKHA